MTATSNSSADTDAAEHDPGHCRAVAAPSPVRVTRAGQAAENHGQYRGRNPRHGQEARDPEH
jgi:hypothetical protein